MRRGCSPPFDPFEKRYGDHPAPAAEHAVNDADRTAARKTLCALPRNTHTQRLLPRFSDSLPHRRKIFPHFHEIITIFMRNCLLLTAFYIKI